MRVAIRSFKQSRLPLPIPVDLDEVDINKKLISLEVLIEGDRNKNEHLLGCDASISNCSSTSASSTSSTCKKTTTKKRSTKVVFSNDCQYIYPATWDRKEDRRKLWWTRQDRQVALAELRREARGLASLQAYRDACVTILMHCKDVATDNDEDCLKEESDMFTGPQRPRTPLIVTSALRTLVENCRGGERSVLLRLQLRAVGRPCYYWRCNSVRAIESVLQLQKCLSCLSDEQLSKEEKAYLLAAQYKPFGFYASIWAQLIAEGDRDVIKRDFRRVRLW